MHTSLSSHCPPHIFSFRDDDSGRASCCDPDLSSEPEASTVHPLTPSQVIDQKFGLLGCVGPSLLNQSPDGSKTETLSREALYTQVSEMRSTGKVLLSPELEKSSSKDAPLESDDEDLPVRNPRNGSSIAANMSQTFATQEMSGLGDSPCPSSSSYPKSDSASTAPFYTVVDGVSGQNSLLLTPNSTSDLQLVIPKSVPTPTGYLTPDLLGSIKP